MSLHFKEQIDLLTHTLIERPTTPAETSVLIITPHDSWCPALTTQTSTKMDAAMSPTKLPQAQSEKGEEVRRELRLLNVR